MAYLKIIRFGNLLMAALTQWLVQLMLINPFLQGYNLPVTQWWIVACCIVATFLLGAGGNIINDIVDYNIDMINHPDSVILNKSISVNAANKLYLIVTGMGIFIGSIPCVIYKYYGLILILGFMAALMWYYSYKFKSIMLFGNIVVAFVISFSILLPMFYNLDTFTIKPLIQIITYYTLFSFIIVLAREIIKCMEDMHGDNEYGIRTLPIVAGINTSKTIVGILFLLITVGIGYFQYIQMQSVDFFKRNYFSSLYLLLFVQLPLIYVCFRMIKAQTPKQYNRLSAITKFVMLSGIMSLVVFYYLMN